MASISRPSMRGDLRRDERTSIAVVLRGMMLPILEHLHFIAEQSPILRLLGRRCIGIEGCQRQSVNEVMGRLDRHGHGGAEHGFGAAGGRHCLLAIAIQERKYLLHDVVEDDAATERRFGDGLEAGGFAEIAVVEDERIAGSALQAGDESLLDPDRLVNRIVATLPRKGAVSRRRCQHLGKGIAFFEQMPWRLEREKSGVDEIADLKAGGKCLLQNRKTGGKVAFPEIDVIPVQVEQSAAQA